jgi:hypothetical protein
MNLAALMMRRLHHQQDFGPFYNHFLYIYTFKMVGETRMGPLDEKEATNGAETLTVFDLDMTA